ncbi:GNAT family N-acetyltransferase [Clostridium sp. UBA7503]|uniref:GNAT family N-acetyltransferase n=1 Tax=Clostridium sp. UBA7503 TaxID=1946377 RepID=UPI003217CB57
MSIDINKSYSKKYVILQVNNIIEIRKVVHDFDKVFKPSLSERLIDLNEYAEKLYKNALVFVAIKENEFIGFVAFYANDTNDNIAYLTQIGVNEKSQDRSVGKSLLDLCIKISKNKGMTYVKLEVFNYNIKGIKFYQKHGFYFSGNASSQSIYMMKKLK